MFCNFQRKLCRHLLIGGALLSAGFGMYSCQDGYDLGDKQPTGLSNIYGYMQEQGNYTNYLHLIDELGQAEILSKTGSKTMFIADDDAFAKFFASNKWGVKSYGQLTLSQKKLLLNSSMIDNPYSTSMLSSAEAVGSSGAPVKGEVCRRSSSQTLYDSIMFIASKDADGIFPANDRFEEIRANHDSIVLFNDASNAAPMIHFTGKFITSNKLDLTDVDFIYNQPAGTFKSDEVYVNDAKVVESNIFCKNGFLHKVDNVIMPLDNMSEIIRQNKQMSTFSSILERFAAPDDSLRLTEAYNKTMGKNVDSVFVKRYFSQRSAGSRMDVNVPFTIDKNGNPFDAPLKFDPAWNGYIPYLNNVRQPMMEDMAVMLVPSNAAMDRWWNSEGGRVVADYYHTIKETPNSVLSELVNVNMLPSLVSSVPSQFAHVLNDAQEEMGITMADIDSVYRGCNGLVYLTNKVFAPTSYSSVFFPAIIDTTSFKVLYRVVKDLNYDTYLNSMVSTYTFLLPTSKGLLTYVDPVSYGQTTSNLWQFHLDTSKASSKQLYADVYKCVLNEDGTWGIDPSSPERLTQVTGGTDNAILKNRIEDLLDNIIVTEGYVPGKKYYKTKGRTFVKVEKSGNDMLVSGSWQDVRNQPMKSTHVYDSLKNGLAVVVDGPVMGTNRSVAKTLKNATNENGDSIFSKFYKILYACGAVSVNNAKDKWQAGDQELGNLFNLKNKGAVGAEDTESKTGKPTYLLNNFNYTVYAPTNEAMDKAFAAGLPTLEDLDAAEALDDSLELDPANDPNSYSAKIKEVMLDFVKYHIQDNSIYVDEGFAAGEYESGKTELIPSTDVAEAGQYEINEDGTITIKDKAYAVKSWPDKVQDGSGSVEYYTGMYSPGRPYKLKVNPSATGIEVVDAEGNVHKVVTKKGCYNLMAREYWYNSADSFKDSWRVTLNNSSAVVVHAIDSPLLFDSKSQFTYTYKKLTK